MSSMETEGPDSGFRKAGDSGFRKAKMSCGVAMDLDLPGVRETFSVQASKDDGIWQWSVFTGTRGTQVL